MGEQQQGRSEENLRHEYTEVVQTIRSYSNLRFANISIFFLVMGGVGFVAFGKGQFDAQTAIMARTSGFPVIAFFWWYVERMDQLFTQLLKVAIELERLLGYAQFTSRPARPPYLPDFRVMGRIFFLLLTLFWAYAVFAVSLT